MHGGKQNGSRQIFSPSLFQLAEKDNAAPARASLPNTDFETPLWRGGVRHIAGADEVGRGAWAGPVIAAAVILSPDSIPPGLNDSKKLSPEKRAALYEVITSSAIAQAFGEEDEKTIDRVNILEATRRALRQALTALSPPPEYALIDAIFLAELPIPQQAIIKGDARSVSIAAASILAKVYRDTLMTAFDALYPGYGFARHKGYGTKEHQLALEKLGPCSIHRLTFRGVSPGSFGKYTAKLNFNEGMFDAN